MTSHPALRDLQNAEAGDVLARDVRDAEGEPGHEPAAALGRDAELGPETDVVQGREGDVAPPLISSSGTLAGDIRLVAEHWFGRSIVQDGLGVGAELPTPEALRAASAACGLEITYEMRSLGSLHTDDFPCIVLLKDGSTLLLVGTDRDGSLRTLTAKGAATLDQVDIAAAQAGVVFFVRPAPIEADPEGETHAPQPEAKASGRPGIVREVVNDVARRHMKAIGQAALANLVCNVLMLALPIFSMSIYDRVVPHLAFETLWALSLGVVLALAADFAMRSVKFRLLDAVSTTVSLELQSRFYARLIRMRLGEAPRTAPGLLVGLRELDSICQAVPALMVSLLVDLPFIVFSIMVLYVVAGAVAIVPLLGGALLAGVYAVTHRATLDAARRSASLHRLQATMLAETIEGLETVKASAAETVLIRQWERLTDESAYSGHLSRHWNSIAGQASGFIGQFLIVVAMFVAVYEISDGIMTVGAMAAATLLVGRVMAPVGTLVVMLHKVQLHMKTADLVGRVLEADIEEAGDPSRQMSTAIEGHIDIRRVSFAYPGEDKPALKDVNLVIKPGEKIAIIGRIGSGKSTLLRLLTRVNEAQTGSVLLDGADIRQVSPQALRRTFSVMSQDHTLFDDTLRANICLGLEQVDEAAFERATAVSGVRDFASRHPKGYSMMVGQRGCRLSSGERQTVFLARALLADHKMLVLDEPTASLDNTIEGRIIRDLRAVLGDRTLVVATHRAALLSLVDRVVWMEGGQIVADGPKDEVMRRLGVVS